MIELTTKNNQFEFRGDLFHFIKWNEVDNVNFECETTENIFNFVYGNTKINGVIPVNFQQLIDIPTLIV